MDGVHDVGGMHGFGPIDRSDPPLEPWERTVIAINAAVMRAGVNNIDEFRHAIERMDPGHYLTSPYFEHWLDGISRLLLEKGVLTDAELDARTVFFEEHAESAATAAFAGDPAPRVEARFPGWVEREPRTRARFKVGDAVRTRTTHVRGHTRLPRYARGKPGQIHAVHGVHVFPDTNAHGRGEQPAWLYSVRFHAQDLWPDDVEGPEFVFLDAWEPYLLPAEGAPER